MIPRNAKAVLVGMALGTMLLCGCGGTIESQSDPQADGGNAFDAGLSSDAGTGHDAGIPFRDDSDSLPSGDPNGGDPGGQTTGGTCGNHPPTEGIQEVTLPGSTHWYKLGAPPANGPLPVVVGFHGDDCHPDSQVAPRWAGIWRERQDFILVMPKCPDCCSWYAGDQEPVIQYIWDVLKDVARRHDLDVNRIYAVGYSGGSSLLAWHATKFQEVFAGIQMTCGGGLGPYTSPPREDCKVDARFVISRSDFLWDIAKAFEEQLLDQGHHVDFVETSCSGHCCYVPNYAQDTLAWFLARTKCHGLVAGGTCHQITDLP